MQLDTHMKKNQDINSQQISKNKNHYMSSHKPFRNVQWTDLQKLK